MAHLMYTLAVCWAYLSMTLVVYYNSSNPKHLEIYADTLGKDKNTFKHVKIFFDVVLIRWKTGEIFQ